MKSDIPWKLKTQEGINQTLYKNQTWPENPKGDFNIMSWWLPKKNFNIKTQLFVTRPTSSLFYGRYNFWSSIASICLPQIIKTKILFATSIPNYQPTFSSGPYIYKLFPTFLLQLSFFGEKKNNSFSNFLLHQRDKRHVVELLVVIIIEPKSI